MNGRDLHALREHMGLSKEELAKLIGYTGNPKNDANRIYNYERSDLVPLYVARLVWLISCFHDEYGHWPDFPQWPGYDFESTPDPGHVKVVKNGSIRRSSHQSGNSSRGGGRSRT